jgi:hypothetical protein
MVLLVNLVIMIICFCCAATSFQEESNTVGYINLFAALLNMQPVVEKLLA